MPPKARIDELLRLRRAGRDREVIETGSRLAEEYPDSAFLQQLLGIAHARLGDADEALARFRQAVAITPSDAEAHYHLGSALTRAGQYDAALTAYMEASARRPGHAPTHFAIAELLRRARRIDAAIDQYRAAIQFDPGHAVALNNLGNLLQQKGRPEEALDCYRRALAIAPGYAPARAHKLNLEAHGCDWDGIAADAKRIPLLGIEGRAVAPFMMLAMEDDPARHRIRSERLVAERYQATPLPAAPRPAQMPERLRIGYFSADLHDHATMYLAARMFELHDRERFAIHAYSYGPARDDAMRRRLIGAVEAFQDIRGLSDREAAELARRDGIDIAVDLKGHTTGTRTGIFAFRPAPVQINYLGYPGTIGADFIDYIIADPVLIPERLRGAYVEKVISLPHSYQCNDDRRPIAAGPVSRTAMGLPEEGFVFASFNNSFKLSAELFDIWMRLLGQVEDSVLWLYRANGQVEANLAKEAAKRGIDPARLIFADRLPQAEHLARQRLADLFLDSFNFNAHTTASDALWGGLPIVTKQGESFAARVAASLLTAIGLPELITRSATDYEALALALATDRNRLAALRSKLDAQRLTTPLFDSALFTRNIERGYVAAYQRYLAGLPPDHIRILP